ncbi:hypothetical protein Poli38472_012913 [Pythium oligandrum]|uniref:Uncharacterized protein n=1 Tax=Pythium oligandrum TaxID=41045 RepID=A0A8K1FIX0_PYTOL|nr:hypothetical protein Poli38472_012913 [Pythium oligandrum]|eukprot:TMW64291.1 hypothetical protein Poli38472_012913 [Pythium oligandrum]
MPRVLSVLVLASALLAQPSQGQFPDNGIEMIPSQPEAAAFGNGQPLYDDVNGGVEGVPGTYFADNDANEVANEGMGVNELANDGYNVNEVASERFSVNELANNGLSVNEVANEATTITDEQIREIVEEKLAEEEEAYLSVLTSAMEAAAPTSQPPQGWVASGVTESNDVPADGETDFAPAASEFSNEKTTGVFLGLPAPLETQDETTAPTEPVPDATLTNTSSSATVDNSGSGGSDTEDADKPLATVSLGTEAPDGSLAMPGSSVPSPTATDPVPASKATTLSGSSPFGSDNSGMDGAHIAALSSAGVACVLAIAGMVFARKRAHPSSPGTPKKKTKFTFFRVQKSLTPSPPASAII